MKVTTRAGQRDALRALWDKHLRARVEEYAAHVKLCTVDDVDEHVFADWLRRARELHR
jgi:hypothetical protein